MERIIAGLMFMLPVAGLFVGVYLVAHVADVVIVAAEQFLEKRKQR